MTLRDNPFGDLLSADERAMLSSGVERTTVFGPGGALHCPARLGEPERLTPVIA
jgi:hypothetical protein